MDDPTPAPVPAPAAPGPATGEVPWTPAAAGAPAAALPSAMVYGDLPNRIIAYIIDAIVLFIIGIAVVLVLGIVGISALNVSGTTTSTNWFGSLVLSGFSLAIGAAYFIYSWTSQRATIGMKVLGLQIGNAPDGATITTNAAIKRWLALGAFFSILQILSSLPLIGILISLAALGWVIFLLYTTWKSPTKQGWHDHFANTMIVKATKSAG